MDRMQNKKKIPTSATLIFSEGLKCVLGNKTSVCRRRVQHDTFFVEKEMSYRGIPSVAEDGL